MTQLAVPRTMEITGNTRVWVHLAHPSAHVRSPQVFNNAFRERGLDAVAVSIDVAPEGLPALMRGLRGWRNLAGIGVTMPHKERIVAELDELAGLTRHIGAANAIRREQDGRLVGRNTDGDGFVRGLRSAGVEPAGRRALVVGVGGAGRAIAWTLAQQGVSQLTLANRTAARAQTLAQEIADVFPQAGVRHGDPDPRGQELVINATSLGMREGDPLPIDASLLEPGAVVAEIIMSPARTALMEAAQARGCTVVPGLPMLTSQVELVLEFLSLMPSGDNSDAG